MEERVWKFSRSHDETYVDCPRKCYLQYYYGGTGIVRAGLDMAQSTGTLTHGILERVMKYAMEKDDVPGKGEVNAFCTEAKKEYKEEIESRGFDEFSGDLILEMNRQSALAEGLARVWTIVRLPKVLEQYKVIASEQEHEIPFAPGQILMSRLDGILQRRADNSIFAGPEFKTTGWISEDYIEAWRYSTQVLSHALDVRHVYGEDPAGVMMEFLYKGMKKKNQDGEYVYYSPLVRAYRMKGAFGEEEYGFDSSLGRKKDWEAFDTYTMGMDKWVDQLPEDVMEGCLFNSVVYRSNKELEEWQRQVAFRQGTIQMGVIRLNEEEPTEEIATEVMASIFPARLDKFCFSNQYRKKCPYLGICYGSISDPLESGGYVQRTPHHPSEFDGWKEED